MHYRKPPLSFKKQLEKLKSRNLQISDDQKALHFLSHNSFYRLRAYTYPFQDNTDPSHTFVVPIRLDDIICLYRFDGKLRNLILGAIEKIEISFRTQFIYHTVISLGSHWYLDPNHFRNPKNYSKNIHTLRKELDRSSEDFIKHYKNKYTNPKDPPAWMSFETISFSLLSQFFFNMKYNKIKKSVAKHYGIRNKKIMENWMHSLSQLRNLCAHHSRVWNRRFPIQISIPRKTDYPFVHSSTSIYPNKLYAFVSIIHYLLKIIDPDDDFASRLRSIIEDCPLASLKSMGFPATWKSDNFWNFTA